MSSTISPAQELEAALSDPKREPLSTHYHWTLLHPPARRKGDGDECRWIYETIADLWNQIRENRVRNRADLENWQAEAQEIEVRNALCIPGADTEAANQHHHGLLRQRHGTLEENPWMGRVNDVLGIVPVLLEVSATRMASTLG